MPPRNTLLTITRGHWGVENKFHYIHDAYFNEERRYYRKDQQLFAALKNIAISLCILWV